MQLSGYAVANSRELGVQPLAAPCLCCSFVLLCRAVLFCGTLTGPPTPHACSFYQCTLLMHQHCPLQSLTPPHEVPVGLLCWGRLPGSTMKEAWAEVCRTVQSRASGRLFVLSPFFVHTHTHTHTHTHAQRHTYMYLPIHTAQDTTSSKREGLM